MSEHALNVVIMCNFICSLLYSTNRQICLSKVFVCRSQWPRSLDVGLRLLACRDCGFESYCELDVSLSGVLCVIR
jgi:hypothetical protein